MVRGFGVVVTGSPGAGKSTLCYGLWQWFNATQRVCAVINLDPGADYIAYRDVCQVDVRDLVNTRELEQDLGPNGALVFAMEHVLENVEWLKERCDELIQQGCFLIFDCPGQIELYTHHSVVRDLFAKISRDWNVQLCAVQMVDSHHIADASKYISVLLVCLSSMINLEMPMVHVLSKIDLVEQFGKLDFQLDYYTDVLNLEYLVNHLPQDPFSERMRNLSEGLIDVIQNFNLVSFTVLDVMVTLIECVSK
jgi:GTPase SAR1 family protein